MSENIYQIIRFVKIAHNNAHNALNNWNVQLTHLKLSKRSLNSKISKYAREIAIFRFMKFHKYYITLTYECDQFISFIEKCFFSSVTF